MKVIGFFLIVTLMGDSLISCSRVVENDTYDVSETGHIQKVSRGRIVAIREVKVEDSFRSAIIMGGFAVIGTAGGFFMGGGLGKIVFSVGGALVGATLGAVVSSLTEHDTGEFLIEKEDGSYISVISSVDDKKLSINDIIIIHDGIKHDRISKDTTKRSFKIHKKQK